MFFSYELVVLKNSATADNARFKNPKLCFMVARPDISEDTIIEEIPF